MLPLDRDPFARRRDALATLDRCGIPQGEDYHALSSRQVDALEIEANRTRYRKPKNANGSRLRYFHAMLERRARARAFSGWIVCR